MNPAQCRKDKPSKGSEGRALAKAGSVQIMIPAIQPNNMAPNVMTIGKLSMIFRTSWLPQTMMGTLITRPKITNGIW